MSSSPSKRVLQLVPTAARWGRVALCSLALAFALGSPPDAQTVRGPGGRNNPPADRDIPGSAVPEIHGTSTRAALAILFLGALILVARKRATKISDSVV